MESDRFGAVGRVFTDRVVLITVAENSLVRDPPRIRRRHIQLARTFKYPFWAEVDSPQAARMRVNGTGRMSAMRDGLSENLI